MLYQLSYAGLCSRKSHCIQLARLVKDDAVVYPRFAARSLMEGGATGRYEMTLGREPSPPARTLPTWII
jgi:hypothetical protein